MFMRLRIMLCMTVFMLAMVLRGVLVVVVFFPYAMVMYLFMPLRIFVLMTVTMFTGFFVMCAHAHAGVVRVVHAYADACLS